MIRKTSGASPAAPRPVEARAARRPLPWTGWLAWLAALLMVIWLGYVILLKVGLVQAAGPETAPAVTRLLNASQETAVLPQLPAGPPAPGEIDRTAGLRTIIPTRPRSDPVNYLVEAGDSVFGIAQKYKLKPETVLWANYDLLNDNPNMLTTGQELSIPAVDGVIYKVKDGDTVEGVAKKFFAKPEDIIAWPGNHIDVAEPILTGGKSIMIPGGVRETRSWVVPTFWRANAGANKSIAAGCNASGTAVGTGAFMWPADNHSLSGNDFWSGHLGVDIAAAFGAPVYAADSGVVVYAASISGGYGLMVMIDHGNGFHTVYAHNSSLLVSCGQNVAKGQVIAYAGSTGNSTGPHLHFEIRYFGAFVNPHDYLR